MRQRVPVPLATKSNEGRSRAQSSENLINLYPEKTDNGVVLHSAFGSTLFSSLALGQAIRGQRAVLGRHFAIAGQTAYEINSSGTATAIGTVEGSKLCDMDAAEGDLVIVADQKSYSYGLVDGVFQELPDPDFPELTSCAFLNRRMLYTVKGKGEFIWSEVGDAKVLDALAFATAESRPDNLIAVRNINQIAVLLGTESTEFWVDTGDVNAPFARSGGSATIDYGLLSRDSFQEIANGAAMLARDRDSGGAFVAFLNGVTAERISTPAVEHVLEQASNFSIARAISYALEGHTFYELTLPGLVTLVYDFTSGRWHQRVIGDFAMDQMPLGENASITHAMNGENRIVGGPDGYLYKLDTGTFTHAGQSMVREATLPPMRVGHFGVIVHNFELAIETGVGLTTGQGSDPKMFLSVSRDQGRTWGNPTLAAMHRQGQTGFNYLCRWPALGVAREWMFKVRCPDAVKVTIMGAYADIETLSQ